MQNKLEIKLTNESSDLSVFDKHPQQVLRFCATFEGEEYFFEGVVTIERNMFKKQIEFKKEYKVLVEVYFRKRTHYSVSILIGDISEFEISMNVEIIISRIMERNDMTMSNVLSELSNV
jgi:uncharacterized protein YrzB (UPF0473 family)